MEEVKGRGSIHRDPTYYTPAPIRNDHSRRAHSISETSIISNSDDDREESFSSEDIQKSREEAEKISKTKIVHRTQHKRKWFIFLLVALLGYIAFRWNTPSVSYQDLKLKYPQQSEYLWDSLRVGVENIINKTSENPSVYLFTYRRKGSVKQLISDIAKKTSSFIGNRSPVELRKEDFSSKNALADYGYIIHEYKTRVEERNLILIIDLNEIPAEGARALHSICDTHSPLVKNVIIFLTVATLKTSDNPTRDAENTLIDLWGPSLNSSDLGPLISRVTDHVILLND